MTLHFRALAAQAAEDSAISAQEILALRRAAWPDGKIDPEEAEAIFILNDQIKEPTREWSDFFLEALVEFVVNGTDPRGHISSENARWLIERVSHDGKVDSLTELELLVRVLEKAYSAPDALRMFVLEQIEREVLTGEGPTRCGGMLDPGSITAAECTLIRRTIFASGGDRPAGVSQSEAEMLFRLKDETLGANNAPAWERLFVQGVGNYLQGWNGAKGITRERAAELEGFMNDRSSHIGGFFGRMAKTSASGFAQAVRDVTFGRKQPQRDIAGEAARDHAVTDTENLWLQARMDADGQIDPLEEALLAFLAEEA
ncbi:MAG: hypothetical protein B7Y36_05360 [Novosphingobium sp. 28-62-57]|uniref:hypothetical protein n=1 Tax=unclassified Novosphingobium TaxID=2644732 RepID=UPI000BD772E8|nr:MULTISPECIES: hypothetical protein [unclassified Novosphingobium]OYW50321.1 MAG: hypothetical protein B7Z34_05555 [Novosphingobium sp. 12-62-10]OYZ11576.1 MAG: hypothetical protein B7Y36_05360 [Novosphingobium sp. 28-62-57]HQS70983.1 hypothetical protein [Novosphingobium sp.]